MPSTRPDGHSGLTASRFIARAQSPLVTISSTSATGALGYTVSGTAPWVVLLRPRRSVSNVILSAGVPGSVAIGVDAAGLCLPDDPVLPVPCIDSPAERSFAGAVVEDNLFWTGTQNIPSTKHRSDDWRQAALGRPRRLRAGRRRERQHHRRDRQQGPTSESPSAVCMTPCSRATPLRTPSSTPSVTCQATYPAVRWSTWASPRCLAIPYLALKPQHIQHSTAVCFIRSLPAASSASSPRRRMEEHLSGSRPGSSSDPWGYNYRPSNEDHIDDEWDMPNAEIDHIIEDFRELKQLGANVVRIHPQFNKYFISGPAQPSNPPQRSDYVFNHDAFDRLYCLVIAAGKLGIYLDITGLGAWRPTDNNLPDSDPEFSRRGRLAVAPERGAAVVCAKYLVGRDRPQAQESDGSCLVRST